MTDLDRIERLERDNAALRATITVLREQLARHMGKTPPLWRRVWRWLVELPSAARRKRMAKRLAEADERERQQMLMLVQRGDE